eukprot:COSAG05_NODE_647_length_8113_cov_15.485900_5_plen_180_part_00
MENKRLGHLSKMTADYAKLLAADRDELVATVTTAVVSTAWGYAAAGLRWRRGCSPSARRARGAFMSDGGDKEEKFGGGRWARLRHWERDGVPRVSFCSGGCCADLCVFRALLQKMTPKQTKALEAALKAHKDIGGGKAVSVVPKVDAKIRGGMVVELDDVVVDLSVLTKLTELKLAMSG